MSADRLNVTNFAVQYSNLNAQEIAASDHDLVIVEGHPLQSAQAGLTDEEVASLVNAGKEVIGYVSVGQTDDARPYWDASWTDNGLDTGNPTGAAPDWLAEKAESWPAAIVEFWNPDWQDIVITQVEDLAARGYTGIFLDNMLSYYEIAQLRGEIGTAQSEFYAAEMMKFVIRIAEAGAAINPDFAVIPNGAPYIIWEGGAAGAAVAADYLEAIDAIMGESFFGLLHASREEATLDILQNTYAANGIDVLSLEYSTDDKQISEYVAEALERGFAPSISPTQALDVLPPALVGDNEPTKGVTRLGGAGADELDGTGFADVLKGAGGNDTLTGRDGDDALYGGNGADKIHAGQGLDLLLGGAGADRMWGGSGSDRMKGGAGVDIMQGGTHADAMSGGFGHDRLFGGRGDDRLAGQKGNDLLRGGAGEDTFVFDFKGTDRITDFNQAQDTILLTQNRDYTVQKVAGGVRLDFDGGGFLRLDDFTKSEISQIDFDFV